MNNGKPKIELDAMDLELYGMQKRINASRRRVGAPPIKSDGSVGKRTGLCRRNYRKTAVANAKNTETWANRVA